MHFTDDPAKILDQSPSPAKRPKAPLSSLNGFEGGMEKSEICSRDGLKKNSKTGWKVDKDSDMNRIIKNHLIEIDPKRNARRNLLTKMHQNNSKNVWQITHEGKKSIQLFSAAEPAK